MEEDQEKKRPPRVENVLRPEALTSGFSGEYILVGRMAARNFIKYQRPDHPSKSRFGFFYLTPAEYEVLGKPERIEVDTVIRKK